MELIPEERYVYANSRNVASRLERYCGLEAKPLYHPPANAERFCSAAPERFLFCPSRISPIKRQCLVIEALAHTREPVAVKFAGLPDSPSYFRELREHAATLGVERRVEWLGEVSEEEKIDLYARCLGVVFPPVDEDYGYVTLEAMLSSKPVVTCTDSGGPLEFVVHRESGWVSEPTPQALGEALDELWSDESRSVRYGEAAREIYRARRITWANVIEALLRD
jgi:glycosyltransferase involved in cell wall biosynthesis